MAIQAKFEADFEQFKSAVSSAGASLTSFQTRGEQGQQDLLDKIGESGGRMRQFADATGGAVGPSDNLTSSFRAFDGILASTGINISPYVRGLVDIRAAATAGAGALGAFATAGVVVGTGLLVAKLIEAGKEFFEVDKKIADATARLRGWGDVAREEMQAGMDVLVQATHHAGREITNMSEAMQINADWLRDNIEKNIDWTGRLSAAQREVRNLSDAEIAHIEIMQRAGATTEQITNKYHISADGLKALAERQKLAGQAADMHTKALDIQRDAVQKLDRDYEKLMSDIANEKGLAQMKAAADEMARASGNAAAAWIKAQVDITKARTDSAAAVSAADKAYLTEQDALIAASDALATTHTVGGQAAVAATGEAVQGYAGLAQQVTITGDAIKEWINLMKYSAQVNAILSENSLFTSTSQRQRIAGLSSPTLSPAAAAGGRAGATFAPGAIVLNIVDTEANIARRVSAQIMQSVMQGTQISNV